MKPTRKVGVAVHARLEPTSRPASPALLPLGAMLLATSLGAMAQSTPKAEATLSTVTVKEQADPQEIKAKNSLKATHTRIGKGTQALRDIPQTVTVMTEMLLDDRNLDDFREVLKTTAGVTFQAGETGEEDIRMRGFSLGQAGDIYVDGLKDAPLIERDTFNTDRVEVLKGSASMLFGKGSTGGVVNQVSKQPFLMDQSEVELTLGSGRERRLTGDFNLKTGNDAALRINAMAHNADHHGATIDKKGVAPTYRWGIGLKDEFSVGLFHLETDNTPLYNHPWFTRHGEIIPTLPAKNYYGLASDYLKTQSTYGTFSHTHRFDKDTELKTTVRHGTYERDLVASVVRFGQTNGATTSITNPFTHHTPITRTPKGRIGFSDLTQIQSDFSDKFEAFGKQHALIAGVDLSMEDAQRNQSYAEAPSGLSSTVGTPNNGDLNPNGRPPLILNTFKTKNLGLYAQDTIGINDHLKVMAGLRVDHFRASYFAPANGTNPSASFKISDTLLSPRLGMLFQPSANQSYYASVGTSYNTSGDTYQFALGAFVPNATTGALSTNQRIANTPPEKSRNVEIGGKFDLFDNKASLGIALFHSEKYNERNTDEPSADSFLLSGKRHATGMEFNFAGRLTPKWELFYNHTWIPTARIDDGRPAGSTGTAQQEGDRPALTPKHSASLWTTYRVTPMWRLGVGLNHRSKQSPDGRRDLVAKSFTTVDAMVEYTASEATTVKLNVTNLTDELYADSLYRGFYAPGAPRVVQVTLKHSF
jgi:catecholate siderophore receptor